MLADLPATALLPAGRFRAQLYRATSRSHCGTTLSTAATMRLATSFCRSACAAAAVHPNPAELRATQPERIARDAAHEVARHGARRILFADYQTEPCIIPGGPRIDDEMRGTPPRAQTKNDENSSVFSSLAALGKAACAGSGTGFCCCASPVPAASRVSDTARGHSARRSAQSAWPGRT